MRSSITERVARRAAESFEFCVPTLVHCGTFNIRHVQDTSVDSLSCTPVVQVHTFYIRQDTSSYVKYMSGCKPDMVTQSHSFCDHPPDIRQNTSGFFIIRGYVSILAQAHNFCVTTHTHTHADGHTHTHTHTHAFSLATVSSSSATTPASVSEV